MGESDTKGAVMSIIETPSEADATGLVADFHASDAQDQGYVASHEGNEPAPCFFDEDQLLRIVPDCTDADLRSRSRHDGVRGEGGRGLRRMTESDSLRLRVRLRLREYGTKAGLIAQWAHQGRINRSVDAPKPD
jgi:hypothetical protein